MSKSVQVCVNIEPSLKEAYARFCHHVGESEAGYARRLIIEDLERRGLLTESLKHIIIEDLDRRKVVDTAMRQTLGAIA